jgi:hypothetical protein
MAKKQKVMKPNGPKPGERLSDQPEEEEAIQTFKRKK